MRSQSLPLGRDEWSRLRPSAAHQSRSNHFCQWAIEALLLAMVVASPWALGGTLPGAILALQAAAGLVLVLWAIRILLTRTVFFRADGVLGALASMTLLAAVQLIPLPATLLDGLSPNTLETNTQLRPAFRERLPDEVGAELHRPETFPLSLSPPETREHFHHLFLLTLLYAAARSNLAGPGPLARLAWACAINGALLGLLAIGQRLSSPPTMIYWSIPTENFVAGPFVNRNHLPDYATVCLGLACALLAPRFREGFGATINRPSALWLLVLVGAIGAGIAVSLSRGGIVALLIAAALSLMIWLRQAPRASGLGWVLWVCLAVAAVGSWVGWSSLTNQLGSLEPGRGADDGRLELWTEGLQIFLRHPLFGTGGGTFDLVEPSMRTTPGGENLSAEHAHNEFVEALAEGGLVRFALTLLLVAVPVRQIIRRQRMLSADGGSELLMGGLFGLLALAVHSFVDFGLHLPAIAVLAVVLLANLRSASDLVPSSPSRQRRILAAASAIVLVAIAGLIGWDALTAYQAERCRSATLGMTLQGPPSRAQSDRAVRLMAAASAARPDNALYQHELGQAYLMRALNHPVGSPERQADLQEALRAWRLARDLSPLMAPTQARLGRYRDLFASADPALRYFERARSLLPTDATMIYYCGLARWEGADVTGACADWRQSLTNSPEHLAAVIGTARVRLEPEVILRAILPENPALILAAADLLAPASEPMSVIRRVFLERARELASARADKTSADSELEARIETALGQPDRAAAAYRRAVGLSPRNIPLRLAYAQALRDAGALTDARREFETVLEQEPGNRTARDLRDVVIREIELRPKN